MPSEPSVATAGTSDGTLDETEIHDVLRNERRRTLLTLLAEDRRSHTVREISERLAERESGVSPAPRDLRQSVYVSLQQTHIPKLDELGVVEYDRDSNEVALAERAGDVTIYLEIVPQYGLAWSEYYVGVGTLGLLTLVASAVGVPGLSRIAPLTWTTMFLVVVVASGAYHTWTLGSTVFHRTRD